ncbi:MAG: hypothetical protein KZQ76_06665, partial [Candidatus Thiodiazotropha sp. (ex Epidulcina cf. delphinae)]|nr:hypothetical protein [Candidatus Thiodiazotropha sp. (ex Epidulcina cf. delphinae)]
FSWMHLLCDWNMSNGVDEADFLHFELRNLSNKIYWRIMNLSPGPDAESELTKFLILFQWPVFIIIGGILGNWFYKKYLNRDRELLK